MVSWTLGLDKYLCASHDHVTGRKLIISITNLGSIFRCVHVKRFEMYRCMSYTKVTIDIRRQAFLFVNKQFIPWSHMK